MYLCSYLYVQFYFEMSFQCKANDLEPWERNVLNLFSNFKYIRSPLRSVGGRTSKDERSQCTTSGKQDLPEVLFTPSGPLLSENQIEHDAKCSWDPWHVLVANKKIYAGISNWEVWILTSFIFSVPCFSPSQTAHNFLFSQMFLKHFIF